MSDMQYSNKIDQNDLESNLLTLSRHFWPKIPIFSHFWAWNEGPQVHWGACMYLDL